MRYQVAGRRHQSSLTAIGLVVGAWLFGGVNSATAQTGTQPDEVLTLQEAVQQAIAWYPTIAESLGRLYQQNEQVAVAQSAYFPQVDGGLSSEYRTSTNQTEEAFNISATQQLYDFGKVASDISAEKSGVVRDQARVKLAIDQLALDVSQTVVDIQRFKKLLQVAQAQIEGVSDIQALSNKRAELGASTQSDTMQAQSRLEAARETREQFQSQLTIQRNNLRRLVGQDRPISVVDTLPKGLEEACNLAEAEFNEVPEVMVADAQRDEARAQIERRQADFYPTISAEARFNQFLNQRGDEDDTDLSVRLNVTSSLYKGGATRAQRRSADFALQALQSSKDNILIDLERRLQDAQEQTLSAQSRFAILESRATNIEKTKELYRQQYLSLGTRSLLDLLNAEQEIHQARFDQINTRYDMLAVQLECLYASSGFRDMFEISDDTVQGVSLSP